MIVQKLKKKVKKRDLRDLNLGWRNKNSWQSCNKTYLCYPLK